MMSTAATGSASRVAEGSPAPSPVMPVGAGVVRRSASEGAASVGGDLCLLCDNSPRPGGRLSSLGLCNRCMQRLRGMIRLCITVDEEGLHPVARAARMFPGDPTLQHQFAVTIFRQAMSKHFRKNPLRAARRLELLNFVEAADPSGFAWPLLRDTGLSCSTTSQGKKRKRAQGPGSSPSKRGHACVLDRSSTWPPGGGAPSSPRGGAGVGHSSHPVQGPVPELCLPPPLRRMRTSLMAVDSELEAVEQELLTQPAACASARSPSPSPRQRSSKGKRRARVQRP